MLQELRDYKQAKVIEDKEWLVRNSYAKEKNEQDWDERNSHTKRMWVKKH